MNLIPRPDLQGRHVDLVGFDPCEEHGPDSEAACADCGHVHCIACNPKEKVQCCDDKGKRKQQPEETFKKVKKNRFQ